MRRDWTNYGMNSWGKYASCPKTVVWNRQKADFLAKIGATEQNNITLIRIDTPIEEDEELGLLDYREAFDNHIASIQSSSGSING